MSSQNLHEFHSLINYQKIYSNAVSYTHLDVYKRQIMWLSVKQNIALPQFFHPQEKQQILLDMQAFENASMSSLSLGQRQRIAYLRTRYHKSDILLCDEPTGSLDPIHAKEIMELLKEEAKQRLVILVSHCLLYTSRCV